MLLGTGSDCSIPNAGQGISGLLQMMHRIRVVPQYNEVFGGSPIRQIGQCAHGAIRIGVAGRVSVLRYAPDGFDARVCSGQFSGFLHIRAVFKHGNIDHFHAEMLAQHKVPIVAGDGRQYLNSLAIIPLSFIPPQAKL